MNKDFKAYLTHEQYRPNTIAMYLRYVGLYLEWLSGFHIKAEEIRYPQLITFIAHLQSQNQSIQNQNNILIAIRHYYKHLQIKPNPAGGIIIKGKVKTLPSGQISKQVLDTLYQGFPEDTHRQGRNKVILGLLIYQGLSSEDLHLLRVEHISLKTGTLHVPAGSRLKGRTLKLEPFQILELQQYMSHIRPVMLAALHHNQRSGQRSGRKPRHIDHAKLSDQLLISENGSTDLKPSLKALFMDIRNKRGIRIRSAREIRQSIITAWLREESVRVVQYKTGHKTILALERYNIRPYETMKEQLEKLHPLQ